MKEVRVNPYVILGCMLSADMNLFTFADNLDVVEAVNSTGLGTYILGELTETSGVGALTTGWDADNDGVFQVHERKSLCKEP